MNRTLASAAVVVIGAFGFVTACSSSGAASTEHKEQATASQQLVTAQPIPQFTRSQLRQNLIEVETAEAQGVQTTSFFFNQGDRDPIQTCTSIGAPIPTTAQLSNPLQKQQEGSGGGGNVVIGQMDPDGVYTGDSSGTYVMCVGANGEPYADYWEGFVQTVFGPAVWDESTHQVQLVGPASFHFTKGH